EPSRRFAASSRLAGCWSRHRTATGTRTPLPVRAGRARPGARMDRPLRAVLGRSASASTEAAIQEKQRMTKTIQRELLIPQAREQVWRAIADRTALAGWMFPNDFEPRVGHRFTFQVPANPKLNFDGLVVQCEVLKCDPPSRLAFSWSAGGLEGTQVSFRL